MRGEFANVKNTGVVENVKHFVANVKNTGVVENVKKFRCKCQKWLQRLQIEKFCNVQNEKNGFKRRKLSYRNMKNAGYQRALSWVGLFKKMLG